MTNRDALTLFERSKNGRYPGFLAELAESFGMMMVKVDSSDGKIVWRRPQFYQGGRLTRAASNGSHLFVLHPTGKLRRIGLAQALGLG